MLDLVHRPVRRRLVLRVAAELLQRIFFSGFPFFFIFCIFHLAAPHHELPYSAKRSPKENLLALAPARVAVQVLEAGREVVPVDSGL